MWLTVASDLLMIFATPVDVQTANAAVHFEQKVEHCPLGYETMIARPACALRGQFRSGFLQLRSPGVDLLHQPSRPRSATAGSVAHSVTGKLTGYVRHSNWRTIGSGS